MIGAHAGAGTASVPEASPGHCRLTVTGMDCGGCARTIEASLAALPGVRRATVNFAQGSAAVTYDTARVSPAAIVDRIAALG